MKEVGHQFIEYSLTIQSDNVVRATSNGSHAQNGKLDLDKIELSKEYNNAANENVLKKRSGFQKFGGCLFNALFAEPIEGHFREQAWRKMEEDDLQETCIRIHIIFQGGVSPIVSSLPWEFLYYPEKETFLGSHPKLTLSYGYFGDQTIPHERYCEDDLPLRILFVHTHPTDLDGIGVFPVRSGIQSLINLDYEFIEIENKSISTLREAIDKYRPHVFHFLGHGQFEKESGEFALLGKESKALWYDSQSFNEFFRSWRPNLIVLQCCQSGDESNLISFTGGAAWLARNYVPAIIAMRYPFTQGTGWIFFTSMYKAIAEHQSIDVAVQLGRRALAMPEDSQDHSQREFGAPVLWRRPGFTYLFDHPKVHIGNKIDSANGIDDGLEDSFNVKLITDRGFQLNALSGSRQNQAQGYLNLLRERVGFLKMSQVAPDQPDGIPLEHLYTPSPTNLVLNIEIIDQKVKEWSVQDKSHIGDNYLSLICSSSIENSMFDNSVINLLIDKTQLLIDGKSTDNSYERKRPLILAPLWADQSIKDFYTLEAIDIVSAVDRLVILGDPGSGKSTFAKYLALSLLGPQLLPLPKNLSLSGLKNWPHGLFVPIYVELRQFVLSKYFPELGEPATAKHFWEYVKNDLLSEFPGFVDILLADLTEGRALIILDGLDEVPVPLDVQDAENKRRKQLKTLAQSLHTRYRSSRIVITSRPYAYEGWKLDGFMSVTLTPLGMEQKHQLVSSLYLQASEVKDSEEAQDLASRLLVALETIPSSLTVRPLFLTLLAILFLENERNGLEGLPRKRGSLIHENIKLLLGRWTESRRSGKSLMQQLGCTEKQLYERLESIAFKIQSKGQQKGEEPPIIDLEIILVELFQLGVGVNPHQVLAYMSQTAGILVSPYQRGYRFAHNMFQEFMAASYLSNKRQNDTIRYLIENQFSTWREVGLLIGDLLSEKNEMSQLWSLLDSLLDEHLPVNPGSGDPRWYSVWLAARIVVEQEMYSSVQTPSKRGTIFRLKGWIRLLLRTFGALNSVERVEVGRALGVIGDNRPGVGLQENGIPDIEWCVIPAGEFLMGIKPEHIRNIKKQPWATGWNFTRETPHFSMTLPKYNISRYPITQKQFQAFVNADDGYVNNRWWTADGLLCRENSVPPPASSLDNSPQVEVRWYEAIAFCNWLSHKLGYKVRLPTEPEWEKAARGNDGRIFPWGDVFDSNFCNVGETGIGFPSPVGCFPLKNTAWGEDTPLDMTGNIWEWCTTICEKLDGGKYPYPYDASDGREDLSLPGEYLRVVRGGCFSNKPIYVQVTYRGRDKPDVKLPYEGFRVVRDTEG